MGRGRRSVSASAAGRPTAPGTGSWHAFSSTVMPSALSTGRSCVSTPRPCGPTSMRPGPEKGALAGRGDRPVPRRADHEDSPRLRRTGPPAGLHPDRWERQRLHPVRAGHGPHQRQPVRAWPAQDPARASRRGQGLLVHEDPLLPAQTRYKAAIPERIDQINGRIHRGESRCRLDRAAYRRRNVVERCFNKLKHNKALATRYDKRARHCQALVTLACLRLWLP